jgi:hypothetical protein
MKTLSPSASRARAGMLILALALIGGAGCITRDVARNMQYQNDLREQERERQQRIVELSPRAYAGDVRAMTSLAQAVMSAEDTTRNNVPRAVELLERAAQSGDGLAQAMLGDMYVTGVVQFATSYLPRSQWNDPRGAALLKSAATQACRFVVYTGGKERPLVLEPADRLANMGFTDNRPEQESLWRARSVLHCGVPNPFDLSLRVVGARATPEGRQAKFAMVLLTKSATDIENARTRAGLTPDDVAAGERQADELRRRVAESEKQYPAPPVKELP